MKNSIASLPYPVLGHEDDYIGQQPEAWIQADPQSDDKKHIVCYSFSFDPANKDLISLVEKGDAVMAVEFDCNATFLRNCMRIEAAEAASYLKEGKATLDITLDKRLYAGTVSISMYITAIKSFTLKNTGRFHKDYGNAEFPITPGDVLVSFPSVEKIDLTLDWEHMYRNMGAPVKVVKDESNDAVKHNVLTDRYIEIHLPKAKYTAFKEEFEEHPLTGPVMLMNLAESAITKGLNALIRNPANSSMWAMAIKGRIDSDSSLKSYRPDDGDWDNADLSGWEDETDTICSLILRKADEGLTEACKKINNLYKLNND